VPAPALVSPAKGSSISGSEVAFEWEAVDEAVNYRLVVSTSTNLLKQAARKAVVDVGTATSYVDTGYPANGMKYYWWVFAFNAEGNWSAWPKVKAKRKWFKITPVYIGAPVPIAPAKGEVVTGSEVAFEWEAVDEAVNYRLVVSTSTNLLKQAARKTVVDVGTATSYVDTGYAANGTKYYWWVFAFNAEGNLSAWSEVKAERRWFRVTPVYISAPALLAPAKGEGVVGSEVAFEWEGVEGAVKYKLLVTTSTKILDTTKHKCNVDLIDVGGGLPTTYVDTGYPANGTKYYWWVWAYNAEGGLSTWSEVKANGRDFINSPSISAPALLAPAKGGAVAGSEVAFEWEAVEGAVNYRLVVSTSTDLLKQTARKTIVDVGTATSYVDTGYAANGTKYYWWVWAYNAEGSLSAWSDVSANGRWFANTT
jgi:hypothetical protein